MNTLIARKKYRSLPIAIVIMTGLLGLALGVLVITLAHASTPLDTAGYLDFSYGSTIPNAPTAEKPESKLWWNDGFWWAVMYNTDFEEYRIYRLNWGTQTWEDTGVSVDEREEARADALWDQANQKLYILSHFKTDNPAPTNNALNRARLYRFSYDEALDSYVRDNLGGSEPYVNVNGDKTETAVVDKDSLGRLWVTYISRPNSGTEDYQVYVNSSTAPGLAGDAVWDTPFSLGDVISNAHVAVTDIASLIAFGDNIGVMWSRQISGTLPISYTLNFAVHPNASAMNAGWVHTQITLPVGLGADDHINLKSLQVNSAGQVFAAIKLEPDGAPGTAPMVGMVTRDTDGSFDFHTYSTVDDNDTRPILLLDDVADQVYFFVTGKPGGSMICFKTLEITSPLSDMGDFPEGDCGDAFIEDSVVDGIDNATSTKQKVNEDTTGVVVLASDDITITQRFYVHGAIGNPPPVITARTPDQGDVDVPADSSVQVTFSKHMNPDTLVSPNFIVEDSSGEVGGSIDYVDGTRTATFTPSSSLLADTVYTVTVTSDVEDTGGKGLFDTETWSFTTTLPAVQFSDPSYSVGEGVGSAVITVTLNAASPQAVQVHYASSDGTALQGSDYTAVSNTLTISSGEASGTFSVPITDDVAIEELESLTLTLSDPVNASLGSPSTAALDIVDNDGPPTVQFSATNFNVSEGDASATISVTLSHPSADTITVTYATSDDTAEAGSDYTSANGTLTFVPLDTTETFTVPLLPDSLDEADETVNLTLSAPSNATLGSPNPATLTILDDDLPPEVHFSAANYTVSEADGTATITVTLSAPSGKEVQVDYATSDGTAQAGSDYTSATGTLTFAPLDTAKTFTVPILPDSISDPDETANLTLSSPVNASLSAPQDAVLTIKDVAQIFKVYLPVITR
jgi:hypothetical protein